MALINCPECGKEISDRSESCIHCGYPICSSKPKKSVNIEIVDKNNFSKIIEKLKYLIERFGKKKVIIAAALILAVIIGGIGLSSADTSMLTAEKIKINETYKIKDIGEFEILRAYTSDSFVTKQDKNHIVFICNFTNRTNETYPLSDVSTITAKSKDTKAIYNSYIVGENLNNDGILFSLDAEPNIKTKVYFALEVPETEKDLVVNLSFGEETKSFDYTLGEVFREIKSISIGSTFETEKVASINLTDIAYSNGVFAPEPKWNGSYEGHGVDDEEQSVFLILDTKYMNLSSASKNISNVVKIEAVYDGQYHYTSGGFCTFINKNTYVSYIHSESDFPSKTNVRTCMFIETPKEMINKEVEVTVFIGDDEFVYKGTPRFVENYGIKKFS